MTVNDFMELCLDESFQNISIWNNENGTEEFRGMHYNMPYDYDDCEVDSWNTFNDSNGNGICFNVSI